MFRLARITVRVSRRRQLLNKPRIALITVHWHCDESQKSKLTHTEVGLKEFLVARNRAMTSTGSGITRARVIGVRES